jgi:nitrite reductase (NO-forming)
MSVPQGEVSIGRLATSIFAGLALMFSFGALVVASNHYSDGGAAPAVAMQHGVVADTAAAASSANAKIDANATPGPEWKAYDPALAPAPGGTTHDITLEAIDSVIEVSPGVTQQLWTFGGTLPGPVLRGKVGDVFNVTLVNKGAMGHSIDFHASYAAMNDKMRSINPGESLVYQFKAEHSGIWMYHCGTAPALMHIGNGMYGAVVIDPPNLAPVDHEYVFVQSELYTGPMGQPGDMAKMMSGAFDAVVFNGYVNQYKNATIKVMPRERIRAWVLDAGPNENSAFHIVGTQFDTVFKEGAYLLRPNNAEMGASQTLDLQPSQGGFVEFSLHDPGLYAMVTHKFANVGKGALGLFQAGDLAPGTMAGH